MCWVHLQIFPVNYANFFLRPVGAPPGYAYGYYLSNVVALMYITLLLLMLAVPMFRVKPGDAEGGAGRHDDEASHRSQQRMPYERHVAAELTPLSIASLRRQAIVEDRRRFLLFPA